MSCSTLWINTIDWNGGLGCKAAGLVSVISVGVLTHLFSPFATLFPVSVNRASKLSGAPKPEQCTQQTSLSSNVSIPIFSVLFSSHAAIPRISKHTQLMELWEMLLKKRLKMDRLSSTIQEHTNRIVLRAQHSRRRESFLWVQRALTSRPWAHKGAVL